MASEPQETTPTPPAAGRVVLVTGATGALGPAVVRRFVAAGDRVLATGRDEAGLARLLAEHRAGVPELAAGAASPGSGGRHRHSEGPSSEATEALAVRAADLAEPEAAPALFAAAEEAFGTAASVIAHLAGGFRYTPLADLSPEDWRFLWRSSAESTVWLFRECARRFADPVTAPPGGGVVVAVASPAALAGAAGVGPYAAAKAAELRLVESLARELAPAGGRANAVLPGTMDTPANRSAMPDADPAGWVSTDAVAGVVQYLASPAAAAVNGAAVRVPGPTL